MPFLHTPDDDHVNPDLHSQLQLLLQTMSAEIVPAATVAGDASILREYLTKYPHEVTSYACCSIQHDNDISTCTLRLSASLIPRPSLGPSFDHLPIKCE